MQYVTQVHNRIELGDVACHALSLQTYDPKESPTTERQSLHNKLKKILPNKTRSKPEKPKSRSNPDRPLSPNSLNPRGRATLRTQTTPTLASGSLFRSACPLPLHRRYSLLPNKTMRFSVLLSSATRWCGRHRSSRLSSVLVADVRPERVHARNKINLSGSLRDT